MGIVYPGYEKWGHMVYPPVQKVEGIGVPCTPPKIMSMYPIQDPTLKYNRNSVMLPYKVQATSNHKQIRTGMFSVGKRYVASFI